MKPSTTQAQDLPLKIVGSNKFGRYPKISDESTFNMIISDNFLVDYAGYKIVKEIDDQGQGRGIYSSIKNNILIVVIDNKVYSFDQNINQTNIGELQTFVGDVFITENNANQIVFSDFSRLYVYDVNTGVFSTSQSSSSGDPFYVNFVPGYITFQDTRIISPAVGTSTWRLSAFNDALSWPDDSQHEGTFETKPDHVVACLRAPGRGNLLYVFGETVTEYWNDAGSSLFPYVRNQTLNVDYGLLSVDTLAASDSIAAWLGFNEKSGPVIMATTGGDVKRLSNDGIDFRLARLVNPKESYGFFFKQDGHLLYQLTFTDPQDNFTLVYDFNTESFFYATDENMNRHIAQRVAYFDDTYFFVSIIDGNLYEMSSFLTSYDYSTSEIERIKEIPRVRICAPVRLPDASYFIANNMTFTLEQGCDPYYKGSLLRLVATESGGPLQTEDVRDIGTQRIRDPYVPRIDLSVSRNGAESFSSDYSQHLHAQGQRKNRLMYWQLGAANDLTIRIKFWGKFRFVVTDGLVSVYQ